MIKQNTRQPVETEGDIYSLCNSNEIGRRRLVEMMAEYNLSSLEPLSDYICSTSEAAVREEISRLPEGTWHTSMVCDGEGELLGTMGSLKMELSLQVSHSGPAGSMITLDYTGTCEASKKAINVPLAYTRAYSCFALAGALSQGIPNNAGSLRPFQVRPSRHFLLLMRCTHWNFLGPGLTNSENQSMHTGRRAARLHSQCALPTSGCEPALSRAVAP